MKQGLLWYERGAGLDLESCLVNAVDYFINKYGHPPACCYIHPDLCPQERTSASGIRLIPSTRVLKDHFWLEFKTPFFGQGSAQADRIDTKEV